MIELKNVSVTYDVNTIFQRAALKNVSLKIARGEKIAIVGKIGSGKSTLIQLFNGLIKPDKGIVLFNGENINARNMNLKNVRKHIGVVFQYPEEQFFAETVFDEVAFGPRNFGFKGNELKETVHSALLDMGFIPEKIEKRSPFNLSGGEKRRVAIASIIASNPEMVVLDEPTSGLDFTARTTLIHYLSKENKKGRTLVFVTHDMDEALNVADRIVAMKNGNKLFDGKAQAFFFNKYNVEDVGLEVPFLVRLQWEIGKKYKNFPFCRTADDLVLSLSKRVKNSAG
jgi:energy-coupling factor transport system ATP-binding protein